MRSKKTLVWGIVLVAMGLVGLGTVWVLGATGFPILGGDRLTSSGQRIYCTGQDAGGNIIPRTIPGGRMMGLEMMGSLACVDCHGEDGRGGETAMMFGGVEIPDIRYSELTRPHSEDGTALPAWIDRDIRRAIRDGIEPDGQRLKAPMPRWDMTGAELTEVIAYLKELDTR